MKTIKVSEATPIQLDWLVAKCEGVGVMRCGAGRSAYLAYIPKRSAYRLWEPTKNWRQGGPILDRERIAMRFSKSMGQWYAVCDGAKTQFYGPTPLIAAMRCFVCSRMGETVEVPEELE